MFKISIKISLIIFALTLIVVLIKPDKGPKIADIKELIQKINEENKEIYSISCNLSARYADFYWFYEKPNKVYFLTQVFKKDQAIVSSDGEIYWFWIKDFDSKHVYYCDLDKLQNTRVKSPLQPNLIKSLIFVDQIPLEAKIIDDEILFEQDGYSRVIKIEDMKITEQHWLLEGKSILSIYTEHDNLPKRLRIIWHEEKQQIIVEVKKISTNPESPSQIMPKLEKINLENY